jgi:uncharacterized membrane protein
VVPRPTIVVSDRNRSEEKSMSTLTTLSTGLVAHDHWAGPGPWWPLFPILWILLIVGLVLTFRFAGMRRWRQVQGWSGVRAGEARLAERYAAGEIDEQEYAARLATLRRLGES